jgi:hypothetical protein
MSQASTEQPTTKKQKVEKPTCAICCEPFKKRTKLNKCSHTFCLKCIQTWAKTSNTCPCCREKFSIITYRHKRKNFHIQIPDASPESESESESEEEEDEDDAFIQHMGEVLVDNEPLIEKLEHIYHTKQSCLAEYGIERISYRTPRPTDKDVPSPFEVYSKIGDERYDPFAIPMEILYMDVVRVNIVNHFFHSAWFRKELERRLTLGSTGDFCPCCLIRAWTIYRVLHAFVSCAFACTSNDCFQPLKVDEKNPQLVYFLRLCKLQDLVLRRPHDPFDDGCGVYGEYHGFSVAHNVADPRFAHEFYKLRGTSKIDTLYAVGVLKLCAVGVVHNNGQEFATPYV